jgi:hypothetical protein
MCLKPGVDDAVVLWEARRRETMTTEERHTAVLRAARQYETIFASLVEVFHKATAAHKADNLEEWNRFKRQFESMRADQGRVKDHLILAIMDLEPESTGETVRVDDIIYRITDFRNHAGLLRIDLKGVTTLSQPEQPNQGN